MNISCITECANCGACSNTCPTGAITTLESGLFYKPQADEKKCVDCGLCLESCPKYRPMESPNVIGAYAVRHNDAAVICRSSSGGAFSALAEHVMEQGGVVFGAVFSKDFKKVVIDSTDACDLDALRRSKYTESLVGSAFSSVKRHLEQGRKVLFCGTPCQAAGLRAFLRQDYPNLLICDISCGGVSSHKMFSEYLDALEKRFRADVSGVNFRPKTFGWRKHAITVDFANGRRYQKLAVLDPYFSSFVFKRYSIRESCTSCSFSENHQSDIILSDFWKYKQIAQRDDDDTGISLVLTNTPKGEAVINALRNVQLDPVPIEDAKYNLKAHACSETYYEKRAAFFQEYERSGFVKAGEKLCSAKGKTALKAHIREILKLK